MNLFNTAKRSYKFLLKKTKLFWFVNILKVIIMICSLFPAYALSIIMANLQTSSLEIILTNILILALAYALNYFLEFIVFRLKQNVEKEARSNLK